SSHYPVQRDRVCCTRITDAFLDYLTRKIRTARRRLEFGCNPQTQAFCFLDATCSARHEKPDRPIRGRRDRDNPKSQTLAGPSRTTRYRRSLSTVTRKIMAGFFHEPYVRLRSYECQGKPRTGENKPRIRKFAPSKNGKRQATPVLEV